MLHINDLTYRIEGRTLFDKATLAIDSGHKVGLVGRNGTGKSTLFRLIKGEISPDDGEINLRRNIRMGVVDQEVPSGPESLLETVLKADTERAALLAEADTATDPNRIADIHTRLADIDAYSAEARAATILAGLGFDSDDQRKPCSDFSGGWRMRVALAAMLFAQPDLLLLDEPTNYLDVEGAMWLESHVRTYRCTVFVISHDRDFLDRAVTHIAHLRQGKLFAYTGGYSQFERQLAEQQRLDMALVAKQTAERARLEAFVTRFKAKASKARQAQSRVKRLEKMEPIATVIADPIAPIDLPGPDRPLSPPLVRFDAAKLGYEDLTVLRSIDARIDPDSRIGLLGRNGEGKSTFAKAVLGQLPPQDGRVWRHKKLRIAYFAQHQIDSLNPAHSAYDHVRDLMPDATEAERRARLARFGLGAANAETPAGDLSGGERARLLFSLITFDKPHLLVLDEPANHLDIDSRSELEKALNTYDGAVLLISHDRSLIESVADRLWLVDKGAVSPFEGDMDDYRDLLLGTEKSEGSKSSGPDPRALARQAAARARRDIAPLKRHAEDLENRVETVQGLIADVDRELTIPHLFTEHPDRAVALTEERGRLTSGLEDLEARWLEALERYERAKTAMETDA